MAKKNPSKVIFCHYRQPKVEELAEYDNKLSKILDRATHSVLLHNNHLVSNGTDLDHEFYFLNATIKGEITIITSAGQRDYPMNDPKIVAKLQNYLESKEIRQPGYAQKRGPHKSNPNYGESQDLD